HVLYVPGERPAPSIQEDVLFQSFLPYLEPPLSTAGGFRLQRLPSQPPPAKPPFRVLTIGLTGYGSGVFPIERLSTNEYIIIPANRHYRKPIERVPTTAEALEALDVDAVVVGAGAALNAVQSSYLHRRFASAVQYSGQQTIYLPKSREAGGR
ncbi:MAG TPA: hypothetical protein VEQ59_17030, partial [Polyangiaceae bacterium]|nr:hypothetical protein [Polyangiaceae bacterium]